MSAGWAFYLDVAFGVSVAYEAGRLHLRADDYSR